MSNLKNITIPIRGRVVSTLEQFKALELGTTLYKAGVDDIHWWYYGGVNPKSPNAVMLISSGNVHKIHGHYIAKDSHDGFLTNYDDACRQLLANAEANVTSVKKIFWAAPYTETPIPSTTEGEKHTYYYRGHTIVNFDGSDMENAIEEVDYFGWNAELSTVYVYNGFAYYKHKDGFAMEIGRDASVATTHEEMWAIINKERGL